MRSLGNGWTRCANTSGLISLRSLTSAKNSSKKFFPLYEEMEDETTRMEDETRAMERRVAEAPDATDLEYEKATEALFDMKVKQAALEKGYMEKFRDILSPRQLFELKEWSVNSPAT